MEGFKHKDIRTLRLDVTSDDDVQEVIKTIIENEGRIDVLVNNAGSNCAGGTCSIRFASLDLRTTLTDFT